MTEHRGSARMDGMTGLALKSFASVFKEDPRKIDSGWV